MKGIARKMFRMVVHLKIDYGCDSCWIRGKRSKEISDGSLSYGIFSATAVRIAGSVISIYKER